ncbi:MAG: cupredoxin domain-containing protein [Candidatus Pacebacteria bacterium]|nr:cupredoxin domain-containing protein [Candidatus Paceibacterota bacterium]
MINENKPEGGKKNKALPVIIAIIAVLVLALIVVLAMNSNSSKTTDNKTPQTNNNQTQTENPSDNPMDLEDDGPDMVGEVEGELIEENMTPEQEALAEAEEVIDGGNKVSRDNKVLTREGKVTRNDVEPMSPDAPQQTGPISDPNSLPEEVIKITMTASGVEPASFNVSAGAPVSLSVTSGDKYTHIFKFNDETLSAVAVGVGPNETRAITFQAPDAAGEYSIYCDVPGHTARGETAVMVVQ